MLILAIAIVRFFPVIVPMIQTAAIGARAYWWLVFPLVVISLMSWKMLRRRSVAKKPGDQFEGQPLRDVTGSTEGRSE